MNDWTTPEDIRKRIQREWDNGRILLRCREEAVFPLRIPLKRPDSKALAEQFESCAAMDRGIERNGQGAGGQRCRLNGRSLRTGNWGATAYPLQRLSKAKKMDWV
jgi:hypothetical protein